MEIKTLGDIHAESAGNGMSDYFINTVASLSSYHMALTELGKILREMNELHEAAEHILSLQIIVDKITEVFYDEA